MVLAVGVALTSEQARVDSVRGAEVLPSMRVAGLAIAPRDKLLLRQRPLRTRSKDERSHHPPAA